ncbi:MAG: squalene/phytoene synthase family protein [Paracoccaceae bacterium]
MLDPDTLACAQIVEKGDPLRFRTVMAAPLDARAKLLPLYAFNVEVSRAPWVTAEPMIAEMRLQWWRDVLEEIAQGRDVRRHEVATPLAAVLSANDAQALDQLIAARRWDCYRDPFEDIDHFQDYVDKTAGLLMEICARVLGVKDVQGPRDLGFGAGLAAFLRATPALETAGRIPLVDGTHAGLRQLAQIGLDRMGTPSGQAEPAFWPAIGARQTLLQVIKDPAAVADGRLDPGITAWRLMKASVFKRL